MSKIHTKFKMFTENVDSKELTKDELKHILTGYLDAALWTEEERLEEEAEEDGKDCDISISNVTPDSIYKVIKDIKKLIQECPLGVAEAIDKGGYEQLGHDIHLSSNGHGVGFLDRGYDNGDSLQECARKLGETNIFINNDCSITIE